MIPAETASHPGDRGVVRWPDRVERVLETYLEDQMLWPVLLAILGHGIVVLAPLMVHVGRDHSVGAAIGLLLLSVPSGIVGWFGARRRRFGLLTSVVLTWIASVGCAWIANHYGVY